MVPEANDEVVQPLFENKVTFKMLSSSNEGMLEAKILAMVVLGFVAAVIAFMPIAFSNYLKKRSKGGKTSKFYNNEFSFLFPFGGGVLLCTIFLHLLPEVSENIEELYKKKILSEIGIALPELLTCCGFFMMLIVDGLTHSILHRLYHSDPAPRRSSTVISTVQTSQLTPSISNSKWVNRESPEDPEARENGLEDTKWVPEESFNSTNARVVNLRYQSESNNNHFESESPKLSRRKIASDNHHSTDSNHDHLEPSIHLDHSITHLEHSIISKVSLVRCFLFVLALSVHEFFEGLAIGLEGKVNAVYYLLAAVASHKLVIALCIGVEMVTARIKFSSACVYVITYSIVSPIGILVGMFVLSDADSGSDINLIASALLQGVATGTLLYVVFFEILTKTMGKHESGLIKIVSILVGFCIMLFMQVWLDED